MKLLFQTILRISNQLPKRKTQQKISLLKQKSIEAKLSGGEAKIKSQHERGKLTARERIEILIDPGTFEETDRFIVNQPNEFDPADEKFYQYIDWLKIKSPHLKIENTSIDK